jgi:CheY-like chemotaxis protein
MNKASPEPVNIILAEDDDGHSELLQRNLQRAGFSNKIIRTRDGQEMLDLLQNEGESKGKLPSGPLLLVLDINMPRIDGIELLKIIKSSPQLSKFPVIMLTTTDDPREVDRCYGLGCNVYITKPIAYEAFIEAIRRLGLFLQLVKFPENSIK